LVKCIPKFFCTEYCIILLFAKVVLDGPKEIADSVWQGTHRVRFLEQNIATVFMAGRTGGINATELGLSVHSSTSSVLLCLYNLG
jgi:hypothetical protein